MLIDRRQIKPMGVGIGSKGFGQAEILQSGQVGGQLAEFSVVSSRTTARKGSILQRSLMHNYCWTAGQTIYIEDLRSLFESLQYLVWTHMYRAVNVVKFKKGVLEVK